MSGFFGILRSDGIRVEERFLEQIAQGLDFRGPDGRCIWAKDGAGACFTYLDTGTRHQARKQPVLRGERYWLVGEVRLDARRELVAELRGNGQPATEGSSDEELLILCWDVWGEGALTRILGDFSFALWDAAAQTLCCARDFVGARPFFYAWRAGVLCFSNTLEVLRCGPGISGELDEFFVRDFLLTGLSSDPSRTVWRDIRRLPAGHRLILSGGELQVKRFLQLPIEEPLHLKQPDEYLEMYRELLQQAVAERLPEGKVSLYLSGGLDSSSVCAAAARLGASQGTSGSLKAFTISWNPLFDDPEPRFAQVTARHLGLAHEILEENKVVLCGAMAAETTPEPTSELFRDRDRRLVQRIAAHARVVLSGDGGDDVLTGQSWPYLQYLWSRDEWGKIARTFGGYLGAHRRFPPLRGGFRGKLRRWFGGDPPAEKIPTWLNEEFSRRTRVRPSTHGASPESLVAHPLHPQAYAALHSGYWARVLENEGTEWTRVLLEARAPLLDLGLLRFLLRLPPVPWCMDKQLTRRAMRPWLPVEICNRPKMPLVRDPLEACQQPTGWRPVPTKNPPSRIHEFVKWENWLATLGNSKGSLTWEILCPLSFSEWLKGIENGRGIQ